MVRFIVRYHFAGRLRDEFGTLELVGGLLIGGGVGAVTFFGADCAGIAFDGAPAEPMVGRLPIDAGASLLIRFDVLGMEPMLGLLNGGGVDILPTFGLSPPDENDGPLD